MFHHSIAKSFSVAWVLTTLHFHLIILNQMDFTDHQIQTFKNMLSKSKTWSFQEVLADFRVKCAFQVVLQLLSECSWY